MVAGCMSHSAASTSCETTPMNASSSTDSTESLSSALKEQYESVINWKDPMYSTQVVGVFNAAWVLIKIFKLNPIQLLFYVCGILLLIGLPLSKLLKWQEKGVSATKELVTDATAKQIGSQIQTVVNTAVKHIRQTVYWTDIHKSATTVAAAFTAGLIVSKISLMTIAFIAINFIALRKPAIEFYNAHLDKSFKPQLDRALSVAKTYKDQIPSVSELLNKTKTKQI